MNPAIFARITKVDEAKREVWGRAAEEIPDLSGEIFDYKSSKPYFAAWSQKFADATDGKSLGNIRAMHGNVAAGKAIALDFNDAAKAIDIGTKVVDENEWAKVLEGVYTGFSIGGKYIGDKTTEKIDGKDVRRYTADPIEISLVDAPCIPTCKYFDIVKTDGSTLQKLFKGAEPETKAPAVDDAKATDPAPAKEADPAPAADIVVKGNDEQVAEFAKALNDAGLELGDAIALVNAAAKAKTEPAPVALTVAAAVDALKGMWNVSRFAELLESLASVAASAQYDLEAEGDASPVPTALRGWIAEGVKMFVAMADEESAEMVASLQSSGPGATVVPIMAAARVAGVAKALADPSLTMGDFGKLATEYLGADEASKLTPAGFEAAKAAIIEKAGARHSAADRDRLQAAHDHLVGLGAECSGKKAAAAEDLTKTEAAPAPELSKQLADALERIKALEAQPMPRPTVQIRTVTKTQDSTPDGTGGVLFEVEDLIKNADGSVNEAASAVKFSQRLGGRPAHPAR